MTAMPHDHDAPPVDPRVERAARAGCAESRLLMTRRALLGVSAGLFSWAHAPRWAEAAPSPSDPRLLVVILRGGLDGLNTVVPHGDPDYASMRGAVALSRGDTIGLDSFFGLHPSMPKFGSWFADGEAAVVHATAPPLHNRSHFDAQDNLENGLPDKASNATGWLNRLLTALPSGAPIRQHGAIEIGDAPLILRGPAPVLGWSPTWFQQVDAVTREGLRSIYARRDPAMLGALDRGLKADALASGGGDDEDEDLDTLRKGFRGAGRLLAEATGPRIAVLSIDGFDTHSQQGVLSGSLPALLGTLDTGLSDFKAAVGRYWSQTIVLCVTEFGRTVRANGDRGTDHGVGTAALLAGGAVAGGRVICDWPGLAANRLYEGSDLKPTTDIRSLFKGILLEHLGVPPSILEAQVFPASSRAAPLLGLVRTPSGAELVAALAGPAGKGNPAPIRPETPLARFRRARRAAAAGATAPG
jgi:uncharacterized protein (DUF1501 family)